MSKKTIPTRCIVIDASVSHASGPPESVHPTGAACRDFLMECRGCGHRIAWNATIKSEWEGHHSRFSKEWLTSMFRAGKIRLVSESEHEGLRAAISNEECEKSVAAAMMKDAHLLEAAMATDNRVAALDEKVRVHFGRLSKSLVILTAIVWVNPANAEETSVEWLQRGAPDESHRRLTHS